MTGSLLIVEDDAALLQSLRDTLCALGLTVGMAATGEGALSELKTHRYAVVLLDLNMPGMGGMAACRAIREEHPDLAIIVLTVRDRDSDKVDALNFGADDYVTKPFHLPELIARIGAALRRSHSKGPPEPEVFSIGSIVLDTKGREIRKAGKQIHLTPTEFELLQTLMSNAGRPLAHRLLLTAVWGPEYGDEREYLRTYINQLRKKIEDDPAHPVYLLTEAYFGYKFVAST
ncbi:MAG: response regulator transcription factor [Acidobacteriota bacterium]|jgi:two-component system KDP operon response regulator KdpE